MIRTIIIDDEPSAVNVLSMLMQKHCSDEIQIVGTSNSPVAGKALIEQQNPDLVFLDVEMPGMSGIDLARSFENPGFRIVFTTAYQAYAIEAFRLSALDYLLKPVEAEDIIKVVNKVKKEMAQHENPIQFQLEKLQQLLSQSNHSDSRMGIGMADKIVFINTSDILYCEAHGAYTQIFLHDNKKLLASKSLGEFELQLPANRFFRIHHSYLINMSRIKEYQRLDGGYVLMDNGQKLEVSQRKRRDFLAALSGVVV